MAGLLRDPPRWNNWRSCGAVLGPGRRWLSEVKSRYERFDSILRIAAEVVGTASRGASMRIPQVSVGRAGRAGAREAEGRGERLGSAVICVLY